LARYRKIDVRIWGDQKFRELSPIPPCGQGLWLYLLTSPYTTNMPGLYRAGEAALADDLRWPLRAFRRAFAEAALRGMVRADWQAPLVWVPNAIDYNRPESPNVVKSWQNTWDEIPEVALKLEAWTALKGFVEGLGKGYQEAFAKGCLKPTASRPISDQIRPSFNQEQEQEQEQEGDQKHCPPNGGGPLASDFDEWYALYPNKDGRKPAFEQYRLSRKRGATRQQLLAGLRADIARRDHLTAAREFVPSWPMPKTWLRQDRHHDALASAAPVSGTQPDSHSREDWLMLMRDMRARNRPAFLHAVRGQKPEDIAALEQELDALPNPQPRQENTA
jgi:hypothetical protein